MKNNDYKSKWDTLKERLEVLALGFDLNAKKNNCKIDGMVASCLADAVRGIIQYMDEVDGKGGDD